MILNDFKQQISGIINNAHLSIEVVYFVMKDIFNEIERLYFLELQKEDNSKNNENKTEPEQK